MADYIGAIDQGTTSTRFIVFDKDGNIVTVDQREHEQITPKAGWVEHDAKEVWTRTRFQISVASCSTHPAFGVICSCSRWSMWTIEPSWSNRMQRELVVPWSIAAMNLPMGPSF